MLKGNSYSDNIYEEIQYGDIMFNNIYEMANIFNKYLVNSISLIVKEDYASELRMEKYTGSQFEAFNVIGVNELKRIVNRLENKSGTEEDIIVEWVPIVHGLIGHEPFTTLEQSLGTSRCGSGLSGTCANGTLSNC